MKDWFLTNLHYEILFSFSLVYPDICIHPELETPSMKAFIDFVSVFFLDIKLRKLSQTNF